MDGVYPVQPNLLDDKLGTDDQNLLSDRMETTHQNIPPENATAPMIAGDRRHSGMG